MAGLDSKCIETFLPALDGNVGRCIVAAARLKAFLGAIPRTSVDDLRYVIETTGYTRDGWQTVDADEEMEPLARNPLLPHRDVYGTSGTPRSRPRPAHPQAPDTW